MAVVPLPPWEYFLLLPGCCACSIGDISFHSLVVVFVLPGASVFAFLGTGAYTPLGIFPFSSLLFCLYPFGDVFFHSLVVVLVLPGVFFFTFPGTCAYTPLGIIPFSSLLFWLYPLWDVLFTP